MWSRSELLELFVKGATRPKYLSFQIPEDISQSKAITNREQATTRSLNETSLKEVAALEGSPSFEIIQSVFNLISNQVLKSELKGLGLELGSGIGLLSAAVLKAGNSQSINGILALEAGLPFVQEGIERASRDILGEDFFRIMPCHGSFENVEIECESIDFILQIEALHHAESLASPTKEAYRVLKKGGYLISIDRSWPNKVKNEVLEELVNHEYEREWLVKKGYPSDEPFTRRDNGEHEYRDFEWIESFVAAGFEIEAIRFLHPRPEVKQILKRVVCILKLDRIFGFRIPSRSGIFRGMINQMKQINVRGGVMVSSHPRPLTVFILKKP